MPQQISTNPSTDDSYTDKDARKDRQAVQSVQKLSPEQGYKKFVTGAAETNAALTAKDYGAERRTRQKKVNGWAKGSK